MIQDSFKSKYRMTERKMAYGYLILEGDYGYSLETKSYVMDVHIGMYLEDYEIVSHCRYGTDGRYYSVVMREK